MFLDLQKKGFYKFSKTIEPHVIVGKNDPGPDNGKSLDPMALLGIAPTGYIKAVSKSFVTSLY
jgi:hypothetical protein